MKCLLEINKILYTHKKNGFNKDHGFQPFEL
jgi:hypothetical protein